MDQCTINSVQRQGKGLDDVEMRGGGGGGAGAKYFVGHKSKNSGLPLKSVSPAKKNWVGCCVRREINYMVNNFSGKL